MIVALAGLSMLACNKEENIQKEETPSVEGYTYTIAVAGDTKSYLDDDHMTWKSGDVIGWFTDKAGNSEIDLDTNPRSFQVSSTAAMAAGANIYAYAPYKAGDQSKTAAPLSIPTAQDGIISDAMPMVSLPIELGSAMAASTDTPVGQASFLNLGAVIEYNVFTTTASYASEKVQSVKFTATSSIAGDFTVDLTAVSENAIPAPTGLSEDTVISTLASATTVGDSKANGIKVYQVIAPGTYSGTITVTTDKATYSYSVSSKEFTRGKIKTLNADLANAIRLTEKEQILVGSKWKLVNYYDAFSWETNIPTTDNYNLLNDYGGSFPSALGNPRLLFYKNHAFSLENFAYFKDANQMPFEASPSDADGQWLLTEDEGVINFSSGAFPIVIANASDLSSVDWRIVSLSSSQLHIYAWNDWAGQWVNLIFEPDGANNNPMPSVETTWNHSFETGDFGLNDEDKWSDPITDTFDGKSWTIANQQGAYKINTPWPWSGTVIWNGWGWAYEPTWVTLTSSSFRGTVSSVSLDFTIGQGWAEITANCTVGGVAFGTADQHFTNPDGENPKQTVTFTGAASGTIVITVTQSADAGVPIMLRGIHVTYTPV